MLIACYRKECYNAYINGIRSLRIVGSFDAKIEWKIDLDQFVMPETDWKRDADAYYTRKLRDNDRL